MGIGDWIMATADVAVAHKKHGVRCVVGNGKRSWWSEVFENNPKIAKHLEKGETFAWVPNVPLTRPYIAEVNPQRFVYRPEFRAVPGELYLTEDEVRDRGDYILVEPNTKDKFTGPNKAWPWERWVEVTRMPFEFVQVGPEGTRVLPGVRWEKTETFRQALGVLTGAKLLVTTDGALHHAAAALGIPAVVLWGGAASPVNLGYESHVNLWHGAVPCGTHSSLCPHCKAAMAEITVEEVKDAISQVYQAAT